MYGLEQVSGLSGLALKDRVGVSNAERGELGSECFDHDKDSDRFRLPRSALAGPLLGSLLGSLPFGAFVSVVTRHESVAIRFRFPGTIGQIHQ